MFMWMNKLMPGTNFERFFHLCNGINEYMRLVCFGAYPLNSGVHRNSLSQIKFNVS